MVLSRRWAGFLMLVGVWSWIIWPRFALAIWDDPRAWSTRHIGHGSPTGFLWIHALLIVASLAMGTVVGVLGIRAWRSARPADLAVMPSNRENEGASP
ncbi:MAG TPA: hypothetical protein VGF84_14830 [Micromonosporaceae bacterium]|jgi:hypothetical protein